MIGFEYFQNLPITTKLDFIMIAICPCSAIAIAHLAFGLADLLKHILDWFNSKRGDKK